MQKPKLIVFDIGGVLLDWKGGLKTTAELLKVSIDQIHTTLHIYLEDLELGKISEEDFWRYVAKEYNYAGPSHELAKAWIEGQPLIEAGWDTLQKLKNSGYKVIACTNNWLGVVENQVKNIPQFSQFETIIDSSQEKVRKPHHEMYKLVEERTGYSGLDIFLIDDSTHNCESAKEFGWQAYIFKPNENSGWDSANEIINNLIN